MKKIKSFNYIIFLLFCLVGVGFFGGCSVFASTDDFYFNNFTGDYYLLKDTEGISHLKVVESVTAVFPDFDQNKGICRQIPFTNQDGKNVTLPSLTEDNIIVTRNGISEPIYDITREDGYYAVCTGTEEYVRGVQTYTFEYEFTKVVTEFTKDDFRYQELYWDTNGNGARQKFNLVIARLHFADEDVFSGKKWCYVGSYGESKQDKCTISEISDGVQFRAENLGKGENLTFDVELKAGSFVVPEPEKNYLYVWLTAGLFIVCILCVGSSLKKYLRLREKKKYYEGIFVKPEYQPNTKYSLAEMSEVYLGKKKDMKVAMLLEMVVGREIELKKGEKKNWSILVKKELNGEYEDLLAILNNGTKPAVGDEIDIKRYKASSKLITLSKAIDSKILSDLKKDKLVEKKYVMGSSSGHGLMRVITKTIVMIPPMIMLWFFVMGMLYDFMDLNSLYGDMVFYEYFYIVALFMIVATVIIVVSLNDQTEKYTGHTKDGLMASRYMDGLKLYIKMAEADRMKMLQSVEGVDTSAEGIVKLYEKLLPYAAIFGLEESWMNEMKGYCEVEEIEEPDYLLTGLAVSEISRNLNSAASYVNSSAMMSSSGGSSSSGFSGGGGGGFSGGGGGGGGFSGR